MEKKKFLTSELVTRANQYSFFKHIGVLPSPDKILAKGGRNYDTLRDLKNDPHLWSCIQSRKSGLLAMDWKLFGDSPQKEELRKILANIDIFTLLADILEAPLFGFQPFEILWEYCADGRLHYFPSRVVPKPQEWFFFDKDSKLRIRRPRLEDSEIAPDEKIMCVYHDASYLNPYGTALLSKCYWSCTFKNGALRFWVNFMEKYGMPLIFGQYNRGASDEEISDLVDILASMSENSVIVAPFDIDIKFEEPARTSSVELYQDLIKLCNAEISKAILSQTLTTELDTGSYAASQTHFTIRKEVIRSDINLAERFINDLIAKIMKINGICDNDLRFKLEYAVDEKE